MNTTRRYKLTKSAESNTVYVLDKRTGTTHRHDTREFIYGQIMYNPATDEYPQYIHNALWS